MDANPTIVFQNRMRFKHTLEWNNATLTPPINRFEWWSGKNPASIGVTAQISWAQMAPVVQRCQVGSFAFFLGNEGHFGIGISECWPVSATSFRACFTRREWMSLTLNLFEIHRLITISEWFHRIPIRAWSMWGDSDKRTSSDRWETLKISSARESWRGILNHIRTGFKRVEEVKSTAVEDGGRGEGGGGGESG